MTQERLNKTMEHINNGVCEESKWSIEEVERLREVGLTDDNYLKVLSECISYAREQEDKEERSSYVRELESYRGWEILYTNLMHNAIGKVVYECKEYALINEEC